MSEVIEYNRPDAATFRDEIYPKAKPAILRDVAADLEPVRIAKNGSPEFAAYLKQAIGDRPVDVLAARPGAGPTFFFEGELGRLNFERGQMQFPSFVDAVLRSGPEERMLYLESTPLAELSEKLATDLHLPILPHPVPPRVWMGNNTGTHTHFDVKQNIAYVVGGTRRFTLFPPSQTPNLYMAPFENSPSNAPVSMVQLEKPDFSRFPRFQEALDHALVAELGPGDGIFIPYMWWHHVKASGNLNVLVNYWWNEHEALGSPLDAMLHSILAVRDLPPPMRDAWRTMFDTFVFKAHGEPLDHVEPGKRGGLGQFGEAGRIQLWRSLGAGLSSTMERVFNTRLRR